MSSGSVPARRKRDPYDLQLTAAEGAERDV